MSRPNAIRTIGLEKYLNDTALQHNGCDYTMFLKMIGKATSASMARTFGVTQTTMDKWIVIFREEQARHNGSLE